MLSRSILIKLFLAIKYCRCGWLDFLWCSSNTQGDGTVYELDSSTVPWHYNPNFKNEPEPTIVKHYSEYCGSSFDECDGVSLSSDDSKQDSDDDNLSLLSQSTDASQVEMVNCLNIKSSDLQETGNNEALTNYETQIVEQSIPQLTFFNYTHELLTIAEEDDMEAPSY